VRQIFNKRQLIVIWLVAIVICFFIAQSSIMVGDQVKAILGLGKGAPNWIIYFDPYRAVNWLRLTLIPIIIGTLLVITFSER